ncbi:MULTISPECIES: cytochrome c oxidase subunit II [Haloarcula]|jgi:cytochrome c oxidase subunit 2|uniref:cytochrome-c oxidase n=2 Tax=Haloarcula TaxID=2237 RepID=A0A8J8CCN7_9EURY|nr:MULTISPECIES: cytochrome c oxidase subunit II [Halomicroarcula]MBX0288790.1 cytochrome c oxidase subunit II [Halomicroarcula salinisoli]MBX0305563.1 cytochrome c oxidase subunit II [Halomicroarcula salinisoli]MDS0283730.1 cytochrome c oxidase subunit II [Halomicroarcula sp. S3CR25-11]
MRFTRGLSWLFVIAIGAVVFSSPAAAQSVNRAAIDELNEQLLYVALPLTLFVELMLVYAIYRFHNNDNPRPTIDDPALEVTWTAATGAILVFVGISGFFVMTNPYITPAAADTTADAGEEVEIDVLAYQYGWEFSYEDTGVTTSERLVLPKGIDVRFTMTSSEVIHAIYIPQFGVKQDIFPSQETVARTRPTETGSYRLYCAELCGPGHSKMQATVVVMNQSDYDAWLTEQQGRLNETTADNTLTTNATAASLVRPA